MKITNSIDFLSPDFIAWMQRVSPQAEVISAVGSTPIEFRFTSDTTYFAPGFQVRPVTLFIDSQPVPGEELIEGEHAIARFRSFPGLTETEAAGASWFLGASLETIIKSCSSPTGAPLFTAKNR